MRNDEIFPRGIYEPRGLYEARKLIAKKKGLWDEYFNAYNEPWNDFNSMSYEDRLELLLICHPIPGYEVKTYYKVVAKNGQSCGHKHKTWEAADKCLEKLLNKKCEHGITAGKTCYKCGNTRAKCSSMSAYWYSSKVVRVG